MSKSTRRSVWNITTKQLFTATIFAPSSTTKTTNAKQLENVMLGYLCTHNHILTFSLSFTISPIIRRNSWRMWCLATCAPTLSTSSSTFSTGCTDTITRWPWWGRNLIYLISYMTIGGWRKWLDWHLLEISFYKKNNFQKWYRFDWISGFSDHAFFEQKRTPNFAKVKGQGSRKKLLWRNHSAKVILLVQIFCAFSLHWCSLWGRRWN